MVGEFELIRRYFMPLDRRRAEDAVALGIGDDCALLQPEPGHQLAVSSDTLVSGRHFPSGSDPFLLGQRALGVAASDLAAMGAQPIGFLLALTLPETNAEWLAGFAGGLSKMARHCQLRLIGGDTTQGPLTLTLTVFGSVPVGKALRRDGARVGDLLCVGGPLGEAGAALALLQGRVEATPEQAKPWLDRYWMPQPQLALGQTLRGRASAAIDVSDGLLADCEHIGQASSVALVIEQGRFATDARLMELFGAQQVLEWQMAAGDDYVLAFALPPQHLAVVQRDWPSLRVIGRVEAGRGVQVFDARGNRIEPSYKGYQHFVAE